MTTVNHVSNTAICAAYDAEYDARKPHWIGGKPEQSDLRGIRQIISYRLAIPIIAVAEALRGRLEIERGMTDD